MGCHYRLSQAVAPLQALSDSFFIFLFWNGHQLVCDTNFDRLSKTKFFGKGKKNIETGVAVRAHSSRNYVKYPKVSSDFKDFHQTTNPI